MKALGGAFYCQPVFAQGLDSKCIQAGNEVGRAVVLGNIGELLGAVLMLLCA